MRSRRLDLAFFIDGKNNGMGRRRDVEPNDIVQFHGKGLVIRQFEAAPAVRCKTMLVPYLDDRRGRDPHRLCHRANGPVCGLVLGRFQRQRDHPDRPVRDRVAQCWRRLLSRKRPSTPSAMKRSCHRHTQVFDLPVASIMATVPNPSSLIRMIFARHACFCGEPRFATMASSRILSGAVTSNVIPVRMPDRCTCKNRWESNIGLFCLDQSTSWNGRHVGGSTSPGFFFWITASRRRLAIAIAVFIRPNASRAIGSRLKEIYPIANPAARSVNIFQKRLASL